MAKKKTNPMAVPTYREKPSKVQRVFWWTLPLALVMLVAGLKFVSMPLVASAANSSYSKGNYEQAERQWRTMALLNVVDRWKTPFGVGTAQLQQGNYVAAIRALTRAYDSAPAVPADLGAVESGAVIPRCDIQHNLALAYEGSADDAVTEGESAVALMGAAADDFERDKHRATAIQAYDSAISGYEQAMTTRTLSSCADDKTAHDREQEKLEAAQAARKALDETPPPDGAGGSDNQDNPDDSDNSTGSDGSGDSGNQGNSGKDPSQEPDEGSGGKPNSGSTPGDSETEDPGNDSGQGSSGDSPKTPGMSPQEKQRREELQKRQDEADREGEQMQQDYGPGNTPGGGSSGQGW